MNPTKIEWCDYSSNPIYATAGKCGWFCEKVSPGCAHCYASTMNEGRFGNGLEFVPANRKLVEFHLNLKELMEWQKPKYAGKRVFAFDMTDLFGEWVSDEWLMDIFAAMERSPLTFLILTKRPERMKEIVIRYQRANLKLRGGEYGADGSWRGEYGVLENLWLGVTVENQHWADARIPILLDTPAAVRFLSCEPMLGPMWLRLSQEMGWPVDWVIVGGESGPRHRPFDSAWARSIVAQCKDAGVACFVKQLGGFHPGNKIEELPEDLRVREFPR